MRKKHIWSARAENSGREAVSRSPKALQEACFEYFEWNENNPFEEEHLFQYQGEIVKGQKSKPRAMTINSLCMFLDIAVGEWNKFKEDPELADICTMVSAAIYDQKFTGAASNFFNASLIARDLGLKDTQEHQLVQVTIEGKDADL